MPQPNITKIEETTDIGPEGELIRVIQLTWTLGDQGPFTYQIKKEEFSEAKARQEINKRAQEYQRLLG